MTNLKWLNYFVHDAKTAQDHEDSVFYGSIGRRRSGKSMFELARCKKIYPDFSEEDIVFDAKEFMSLIQDPKVKHQALFWDEPSVTAYNRDYQQEVNKLLNKVLQVFGFKELAISCAFPHLSFLDTQTQMHMDALLKFKRVYTKTGEIRVYAEPYKVITDWMRKPIIKPYTVYNDGVYQAIGEIPIPSMNDLWKWSGVNKKLLKSYQKKKLEFFEDIGKTDTEDNKKITKKGLLIPVVDKLTSEEGYQINRACELAGINERYYYRIKNQKGVATD